jgi:hypothetical protein
MQRHAFNDYRRFYGMRQLSCMYFRKKTSAGRAYLQMVGSRLDGAAVRQ